MTTADERYITDTAVVATGPWSKTFMAGIGIDLPLEATRHEVFLLKRNLEELPFHPGGADMGNMTYFRPEGADLTLVGNGNREENADPDTYNPRPSMDYLEDVWLRLSKRLPGIAGAEFFTGYAGLYTSTPDLHPVIDKVDGIDGLYICTGFSGHGFKLAPAVGTVMAELVLDDAASTVDIAALKMDRFETGETNTTSYDFKVIA